MKKLISIFVILFVLVITTGCTRKNTVHFNPKVPTESGEEGEVAEAEEDLGPDLAVTSFIGDKLATSVGYHVVRGTTPKNTNTIKINDYILAKYYPGQTQWSYIASTALDTLEEGENGYIITSLDKEGNEIDSKSFTINYEAPEALPAVGSNGWIALIISFLISIGYFVIRRLRKVYIKNI
jgi:hypothetical protein